MLKNIVGRTLKVWKNVHIQPENHLQRWIILFFYLWQTGHTYICIEKIWKTSKKILKGIIHLLRLIFGGIPGGGQENFFSKNIDLRVTYFKSYLLASTALLLFYFFIKKWPSLNISDLNFWLDSFYRFNIFLPHPSNHT